MQLNEHKKNKDTRIYLVETILRKNHSIVDLQTLRLQPIYNCRASTLCQTLEISRLQLDAREATTSFTHSHNSMDLKLNHFSLMSLPTQVDIFITKLEIRFFKTTRTDILRKNNNGFNFTYSSFKSTSVS